MTPEQKHIACLRQNWHKALTEWAFSCLAAREVPDASVQAMRAIGQALPLIETLGALKHFGDGLFLRCGGFSWKDTDAFHVLGNGRLKDWDDVRFLLSAGLPRRMHWAFAAHQDQGVPVTLEVNAWQDIPAPSEFRIFIRDVKVAGISQYHQHVSGGCSGPERENLHQRLLTFAAAVLPNLPPFPLVLDVADDGSQTVLIELNPWTSQTDLGLFQWRDFQRPSGELRLV